MKSTKKFISVVLVLMMLMVSVVTTVPVNASTGKLCDYYATNPDNKAGVKKTITIDGSFSDWSEDMMIAQGAAWDVANHYKGAHENCLLDTYALFAAWDDNNLYVAWQMVNTTDTWAREGDGPLSDGGRVLDVPLILALSVDPSSTSMSALNTDGGPIWSKLNTLKFKQHVDHMLFMSGKVGNGDPSMFTAVDAQGNTNYKEGCKLFANSGIEYKMAEGNVCSKIMGLNYSEDTNDVYDNNANWVDYKTFSGSSGKHNTKYDSFYEIKIPLSTLGIDSSYIEKNGIGAMVIATRGESALDCIPFDDAMLDHAKESYTAANDNTSHEKDDIDVFTSDFARIGKTGTPQPTPPQPTTQPTTQPTNPPTTQPTTQPTNPPTTQPTTQRPATNLTVNATSNLFPAKQTTVASTAKTVTVSYDLQSAMKLVNGQAVLSYDSSVLRLDPAKNRDIMPYISDETSNLLNGKAKAVFSNVRSLYDFTSSKNFVNVTFDILGTGSTTVALMVDELSVGYISNGVLNYKNAIVNGLMVDLSHVQGFTNSKFAGKTNIVADQIATTAPTTRPTEPTTQPTTQPVSDKLKVNATSNLFKTATKTYDKNTKQLTISYDLKSNYNIVDTQWVLKFDATKLSYSKSNTVKTVMPNLTNAIVNSPRTGEVKGVMSNIGLADFTSEKTFVKVVFDVIGTGVTDVNLDVQHLSVGYYESENNLNSAYIVDFSNLNDITAIPEFADASYTTKTVFDPNVTILYGDLDGDGNVNIVDATIVQKYVAEIIELTPEQLIIGDVNHDGTVNIQDATLIQKMFAEIV